MSERITEDDLRREPDASQAEVIARALGRRIQRTEAWDAEGAAQVLLPHVTADIEASQRLVAEIRRLRGLIARGVDPILEPGEIADWEPLSAEAEAIRAEMKPTCMCVYLRRHEHPPHGGVERGADCPIHGGGAKP